MKTSRGIRVFANVLIEKEEQLRAAAAGYYEQPVHITFPILMFDPSNEKVKSIEDEITIAVVDILHRDVKGVVGINGKIVAGANKIQSVPTDGSTRAEVLCEGDDITINADLRYGDASVLKVSNAEHDLFVVFDDLSGILNRLTMRGSFPDSDGESTKWAEFVKNTPVEEDEDEEEDEEENNEEDNNS